MLPTAVPGLVELTVARLVLVPQINGRIDYRKAAQLGREHGRRRIVVYANTNGSDMSNIIGQMHKAMGATALPGSYADEKMDWHDGTDGMHHRDNGSGRSGLAYGWGEWTGEQERCQTGTESQGGGFGYICG